MKEKIRVGIFGGTFNPPHIAHVNAAECFLGAARLDSLLIIPALVPPHKEYSGTVTPNDRLEMCRLAFSDLRGTEISDIEISRGGRSYTVLTLSELKRDDNELFLLCGTDMFLTLDSWYMPEKIFELATVCYIRRENDPFITNKILKKISDYTEKYNAIVRRVVTEPIEISSSLVRKTIRGGGDISEMVDPKVAAYIEDHCLFR